MRVSVVSMSLEVRLDRGDDSVSAVDASNELLQNISMQTEEEDSMIHVHMIHGVRIERNE